MKFFSLQERLLFSIHDATGVKLLKRLWLKFSHLKEQEFRHDFQDTAVAMCDCGTETETTEHFSLRCPFFVTEKQKFFNNVYDKHFSSQNLEGGRTRGREGERERGGGGVGERGRENPIKKTCY